MQDDFDETPVVWFYLRVIMLPSAALMGVYHDDIAISRCLFDPTKAFERIGHSASGRAR